MLKELLCPQQESSEIYDTVPEKNNHGGILSVH